MKMFKLLIISFMSILTVQVFAADNLKIDDFSKIKWQLRASDGKLFLRNLDDFDNSFLGCCDKFYIDTTTEPGKALWSAFLSKYTSKQGGYISVANKKAEGHIVNIGNW